MQSRYSVCTLIIRFNNEICVSSSLYFIFIHFSLEILDGDPTEPLVIDPLNAGDGIATGMPDRPTRLILG